MKAQDFRALVEQLGDLTQVQRDALVDALSARGSSAEVVALIETRFAAAPACGHCGETDFKPWGSASSLKRYMCRACGRTFNALTGTPLAGLRLREKWLGYARSLVDGVSLRKAAAQNDIHLETSFRWRHRFLASAKSRKAGAVAGIVEADETFILKSAKGSRRIVGRAPCKRGGKARKPGLSTDEHDAILIVRDRHGSTSDQMLLDLSAASIASHLKPIVAKDAVLVTDGNRAYQAFATEAGITQMAMIAAHGERVIGCYHIQNVNAYVSRFDLWRARFKGGRLPPSPELSRMAAHDRARRRTPHAAPLPRPGIGRELAHEAAVAGKAKHVLHIIGLAPRHQVVAAEARIRTDNGRRRGPTCTDLRNDAGHLRHAAVGSIDAR